MLRFLLILLLLIILAPILISAGLLSAAVVWTNLVPFLIGGAILMVYLVALQRFARGSGMVKDEETGRLVYSDEKLDQLREKHGVVMDRNGKVLGTVDDVAADAVGKALR